MDKFVAISKTSMAKQSAIKGFVITEVKDVPNLVLPGTLRVVFIVGTAKMTSDPMASMDVVKDYLKKIIGVKI